MHGPINSDRRSFLGAMAAVVATSVPAGLFGASKLDFKTEGNIPSFQGASGWLNSPAVQTSDLRDKVAVIDFRTFSCINWRRSCLEFQDQSMNSEQFCEGKQRLSAILRSVQRLEPKMRAVVHAWISQEPSMKELARDLEISTACVKARLHRARKCLKTYENVHSFRLQPLTSDHAS